MIARELCEECCAERPYWMFERRKDVERDGTKYWYWEIVARCMLCESVVTIDWAVDMNEQREENAYQAQVKADQAAKEANEWRQKWDEEIKNRPKGVCGDCKSYSDDDGGLCIGDWPHVRRKKTDKSCEWFSPGRVPAESDGGER